MSETEDFAALFESSQQAKPLAKGQTVTGVIVRIGPEVALVDVGGKSEAIVDIAELKSKSIAELHEMDCEDMGRITSENARRAFGLLGMGPGARSNGTALTGNVAG